MNYLNIEELKKGICLTLNNYENVKDELDKIPYSEFLDLYVTYNIYTEKNGYKNIKRVFKKDITELGLDSEELYRTALSNTMRLFPPKIDRLDNIISDLIGLSSDYGEMADYNVGTPFLYLSNVNGFYGSPVILYDELILRIRELVGEDYYILPSSIHEYLVVPENAVNCDVGWMLFMVRDVNRTCLDKDTILSNNVYHYCHKSKHFLLS